CRRAGSPAPLEGATHFIGDMGGYRLKFERHTEFCSITLMRRADVPDPFAESALTLVPKDWVRAIPGEVFSAVHLAVMPHPEPGVVPSNDHEALSLRFFGGNRLVGATVAGGIAEAYSDLRIQSDRFARMVVRVRKEASPSQIGRLVQRLQEIHSYRALSLLALPIAREISPRLRFIDEALAALSGRIARNAGIGVQSSTDPVALEQERNTDVSLLKDLTGLAAEVEALSARSGYRFGASEAYYDLVQRRLADLREEKVLGIQTFSGFMERRLAPAMATCRSVKTRIAGLSERTTRAGGLLRARVEVDLLDQNRTVLEAMNRRAKLQLRLQEAVEGLSVVAISYYLIGLIAYCVKGLKGVGVPLDSTIVTAIMVPVVFGTVWYGLRRAKKAMGLEDEHSHLDP
ncbi:MAG: DUF3422 family protein, partial [Rhodospirillaceae bacterium]